VSEDPWKEQMAALGAYIRDRRAVAGLSLRALAELTAVSNAYLSQVERGVHEPSLRVLHSISNALDVPLEVLLDHARLTTGADGRERPVQDTEAAILADPRLTPPQRYALLSVYRSFTGGSPPR
jgi:transcriptional regulator with XRE-family HTH domain